eukprot:Sspe_Gene.53368::Locus_29516_Transcript_1_1_Confidence_1.000_Length_1232::g.53368::m.53368/K14816/REI1; pre-60S factor REI1
MSFSCNTCNDVVSIDRQGLVTHYESAFHRENVNRRVNGLGPLTKAAFQKKQLESKPEEKQPTVYMCRVCDKRFTSVQTLNSHLTSQKHKLRKASQKDGASQASGVPPSPAPVEKEVEVEPSDDTLISDEYVEVCPGWETWEKVPLTEDLGETDCLFCNIRCPSHEDALCHMAQIHSFTLPLFDHISDIQGLMAYLSRKVNGCMCLVCGIDGKDYESRTAAQDHMRAVGHTMIQLNDGEYSDFYDVNLIDTAPIGETAGKGGKLVLSNGNVVMSRHEIKNSRRKRDDDTVDDVKAIEDVEKRAEMRLTQQARAAHLTVDAFKRYRALLELRQKGGPAARRQERQYVKEQQKYRNKLATHQNNFHSKGYQGDFVGRTI